MKYQEAKFTEKSRKEALHVACMQKPKAVLRKHIFVGKEGRKWIPQLLSLVVYLLSKEPRIGLKDRALSNKRTYLDNVLYNYLFSHVASNICTFT